MAHIVIISLLCKPKLDTLGLIVKKTTFCSGAYSFATNRAMVWVRTRPTDKFAQEMINLHPDGQVGISIRPTAWCSVNAAPSQVFPVEVQKEDVYLHRDL